MFGVPLSPRNTAQGRARHGGQGAPLLEKRQCSVISGWFFFRFTQLFLLINNTISLVCEMMNHEGRGARNEFCEYNVCVFSSVCAGMQEYFYLFYFCLVFNNGT